MPWIEMVLEGRHFFVVGLLGLGTTSMVHIIV